MKMTMIDTQPSDQSVDDDLTNENVSPKLDENKQVLKGCKDDDVTVTAEERLPLSTSRAIDSGGLQLPQETNMADSDNDNAVDIKRRLEEWRSQQALIQKRMEELRQSEEVLDLETDIGRLSFDEDVGNDTNSLQPTCSSERVSISPKCVEKKEEGFTEEKVNEASAVKIDEIGENVEPDETKYEQTSSSPIESNRLEDSHMHEEEEAPPIGKPKTNSDPSLAFVIQKVAKVEADLQSKIQKLKLTSPVKVETNPRKLRSLRETRYDSPRSIERKNELLKWKTQKTAKRSHAAPDHFEIPSECHPLKNKACHQSQHEGNSCGPPISNQVSSCNSPEDEDIRFTRSQPRRFHEKSKTPTRGSIKTNSRLLIHTASSAARDKSRTPKQSIERKRSSSSQNRYDHVKSKLHSPTAASAARNFSIARKLDSPKKPDTKFILERTTVDVTPLTERSRSKSVSVRRPIHSPRENRMSSPRRPASSPRGSRVNKPRAPRMTTSPRELRVNKPRVESPRSPKPGQNSVPRKSNSFTRQGPRFPVRKQASPKDMKTSETSTSADLPKSSSLEESQKPSTNNTAPAHSTSKNESSPETLHSRLSAEKESDATVESSVTPATIRKQFFPEEIELVPDAQKVVISKTTSSEDSEGDILLNMYQFDDSRSCASNQLLSKVVDDASRGMSCSSSGTLSKSIGEGSEQLPQDDTKVTPTSKQPLSKKSDNTSTLTTTQEITARDCIEGASKDSVNFSFERLWLNLAVRHKFLCIRRCDGSDSIELNRSDLPNNEPEDNITQSQTASTAAITHSSETTKVTTPSAICDGKKRKPIEENFMDEWPKDATKKNKAAKELIEQAYENNDLESLAKICHKFREEFTIARFYIGVLLMEKEDLEKKLVSITDSFQDHIDEHDVVTSENMQLKAQIMELHQILDSNDSTTQESMLALEREMSETLEYAMNKAKGLQKELEMSRLRKRMLENELKKANNR
jgi:hypothetical protein